MQSNRNTTCKAAKRILLVDDEPDITLSFNIGLEDYGYVVDAFNDPLLALSSFKIGLYNMAILDIKMPKMNGFELGGELRKLDNKIKISFISAFDIQEENLKQSIPLLYEEKPLVLKKPISIKDLALIIKKETDQP
ncbi:MAG TPA: response regulator [Candidatus Nitrosocosmicus sp.]